MPDGENAPATPAAGQPVQQEQQPAAPSAAAPTPPPHLPNPNAPAAPQAPAAYALRIPEGSMLDSNALQRIEAESRQRGLSNEEAQRVVDIESRAMTEFNNQSQKALTESVEMWKKEWASDAEIGGDKHKASVDAVSKVLADYATPDFVKSLETTGLRHNVEFGRLLYRLYVATGAGNSVVIPGNNSGQTAQKNPWDIIYDKTPVQVTKE